MYILYSITNTKEYEMSMSDEELAQLGEECWYHSTIADIGLMFTIYGKEKVLTDVANYLINFVFKKLKHKDGFGGGDKYLLAALGSWVGAFKTMLLLFCASWIGLIFLLPLLFSKRINLSQKVPFGAYLILSTPIIFFTNFI